MADATKAPPTPPADADALKSRFKKRCVATNNVHQNWQIRVHRSISWLKRSTQFDSEQPEARFLYLWLAFNSLYSRWSAGKNAPDVDAHARNDFIRRVCEIDVQVVAAMLHRHRGLVNKLLGNAFLSDVFWRDPDHPKAKGWATQDANYLDKNLKNHDYCRVLGQAINRLYVLRGQIVHGASTGGSSLNRPFLKYSLELLALMVPLIIEIIIEHGCNDDWPDLCYPPIR
jgi:hypothetical protein